MKKLLSMLVVAMGVSSLFASYTYYDGVRTWTLEKDKKVGAVTVDGETVYNYVITGCAPAPSGDFTVPAKLGSMKVYGVDGQAFYNVATNITSLTVEEGVRKIGGQAFACDDPADSKMTKITLPPGMDHIANTAFQNSKLDAENCDKGFVVDGYLIHYTGTNETYAVPSGVKAICRDAIDGSNLQRVTLPEGLESVQKSGCKWVSVDEIPDSVVSLGLEAFKGCTIKSLKFGKGIEDLEKIGKDDYDSDVSFGEVFASATIETVDFGDAIAEIPSGMFYGASLGSVRFGAGLSGIGSEAFADSTVSNIDLSAATSLAEIGESAFAGTCVKEIDLSKCTQLKNVPDGGFSDCVALEEVRLPEGLVNIGNRAFLGTKLDRLVCPSTLRSIGDGAFANCEALSDIRLNEGLEEIGESAFAPGTECASLKSVGIPASVIFLGGEVFSGSTNLWTITGGEGVADYCNWNSSLFGSDVPAFMCEEFGPDEKPLGFEIVKFGKFVLGFRGVCPAELTAKDFGDAEVILESAFDVDVHPSVSNLATVAFSDSIRSLCAYAFYGTENLKTVVWPADSSELSLGYYAFSKSGLEEVDVDCQCVEEGVFSSCQNLRKASLAIPEIPARFMDGNANIVELALGDSVKRIGVCAFAGCTALKAVDIPEGVTVIDEEAFIGCTDLAEVSGCSAVKAVRNNAFAGTRFFDEAKSGETVVGTVLFRYVDTGKEPDGAAELTDAFTVVAANAFTGNALAKVTIPVAVGKLEKNTFVSCPELTTVVLKNGDALVYESDAYVDCAKLSIDGFITERGGHVFCGFKNSQLDDDGETYLAAKFEKLRFHNEAAADGAFEPGSSYTGWIMEGGRVVGSLTVKTGKPDKDGQVKVTASVQLSGLKKSYSAMFAADANGKAVIVDADANWYNELNGMILGGNWLSGDVTLGGTSYSVRGGNMKSGVESFDAYAGHVWAMALESFGSGNTANVTGYSTLTVTPAKKGKIKVTGMLADGTKVSATAQMVAGDNGIVAAPVTVGLYAGKRGGFSFLLQFYMDGGAPKMWFDAADADGKIGDWYLPYVHENHRTWTTVSLSPCAVGEVDPQGTGVSEARQYVNIHGDGEMLARKCKGSYPMFGGSDLTVDAKGKWTFAKATRVALATEKDLQANADEIAKAVASGHGWFETADGKEFIRNGELVSSLWWIFDIGSKLNAKTGEFVEGKDTNTFGLSLKYAQKTGAFTGSSLYYWEDRSNPAKPSLKKGKFTIGGVAIDGKLYGAAVAKGAESFYVDTIW